MTKILVDREVLEQVLYVMDNIYKGNQHDHYMATVKPLRKLLDASSEPQEAFCYCNKDVSLQMVSGGGAPEGYLGKVTLRIGDQYREYRSGAPIEPKAEYVPCYSKSIGEMIEPVCSDHPDAPHGFNRNASHNVGRYVCTCEGWMPATHAELMALADAYAKARPFEQVTNQRKVLSDALKQVVRDAERYRWLRECRLDAYVTVCYTDGAETEHGDNLDAAIDAAMKEKP
jgi:hypothetical protein